MMRSVGVFPGSREVRIVEHEEPRVSAPREIKLRMLEVASAAPTARSAVSNSAARRKAAITSSSGTNRWPKSWMAAMR